MDLILEAQRMAELVNGIGFSLVTSLAHFADVPEVAIKEVHPAAVDSKPTAAIHASVPVAESSHQFRNVPVIEVARGYSSSSTRKWRVGIVIEPNIDV
jgi:hypothetical protein